MAGRILLRFSAMPLPWEKELAGRIDHHVVSSSVLRDNPLGDPADRPLWVYVPPGYDDDPGRRFPSVYVLQGYTGHLTMWANRSAYRLPFPEAADELFASGDAPPCVVVFVDAWTAYGGSQFVDSPGTGRYHTYLCDEVVSFVDARYRTLDDPCSPRRPGQIERRLRGHDHADASPGRLRWPGHARRGFALRALLHPRVRPMRPGRSGTTTGTSESWWANFRSRTAFTKPSDETLLMILGVSACFSAEEDGTPVPAVRPVHRSPARRGMATVAGMGPGPHGPGITPTRCVACGPSGSTAGRATSGSSISGPRPFGTHLSRSA